MSEREDKILFTITSDIIKSNEIEGYILNKEQVRSSVARKLGIETGGLVVSSRDIDVVVEMMVDATQNYQKELTRKRICTWQACLFPFGYSGLYKIDVGQYRNDSMQVVSGAIGREKVHYEAPPAERVFAEMERFFHWVNNSTEDSLLKTAIAHLWFVTIHPFEDGNGRIARTISDMLLCRSDNSPFRFYSMSNQIMMAKNEYYDILEKTQKGSLDITDWIVWFLNCVLKAIETSYQQVNEVLKKYTYLQSIEHLSLNPRQRLMITKITSADWAGVLNTSKWAKIAKCSTDTALRDINALVQKGLLQKEPTSGGRSTNYRLAKWN